MTYTLESDGRFKGLILYSRIILGRLLGD